MYNYETGLYEEDDIAFVNTSELTEVGRYFLKYGKYCLAPPGSKDWNDFWDREEERRFFGMKLPGKLITNERGGVSIQEVHIPGQLYGFLNYALIKRSVQNEDDTEDIKDIIKMTDKQSKAATKIMTFPDFWDGHYHFVTAKNFARRIGKHFVGVKSRRKGFSYLEGWDCADQCNLIPYSYSYCVAYEMKYLTGARRIMNFILGYLEFLEKHTVWKRGFLKRDLNEYIKLGYIPEGSKLHEGWQSIIMPMTAKDNPDVARGLDGEKIKIEEAQTFPNLLDFIKAGLPALEDGDLITGQMSMWGTGGDNSKEANWTPFKEIYYNPKGYGFLAFKNVWDDGLQGDLDGCGYCFPYWRNLSPHMDENGNSLKDKAINRIKEMREQKAKSFKTHRELEGWIAERAMNGSEAFAAASSSIFPSTNDQYFYATTNPLIKNITRHGYIEKSATGLKFVDSNNVTPIIQYPAKKGTDLSGCVTFWFTPYHNSKGTIPDNLYRIWVDPYGISKDSEYFDAGDSLGVAYIYERHNTVSPTKGDILIGSYIARPESEDDFNENVIRLAELCNAKIQFENDRGDLKGYAKRTDKAHLLVEEPNFNWDKNLGRKLGRNYGISMSDGKRKSAAVIKFRDWLNTKRGYDSIRNREITNLDMVFCPLLLSQIPKWKPKGNFDTVSTMLVGMFDIEETMHEELYNNDEQDPNSFFNRVLF